MPLERAPLSAQPVDAQAADTARAISSATTASYSKPPNSFGRQVRSSSASRILAIMCGAIVRLRSVSSANSRISGTIALARATSSSGPDGVTRRTAALVIGPLREISVERAQDAPTQKARQAETGYLALTARRRRLTVRI